MGEDPALECVMDTWANILSAETVVRGFLKGELAELRRAAADKAGEASNVHKSEKIDACVDAVHKGLENAIIPGLRDILDSYDHLVETAAAFESDGDDSGAGPEGESPSFDPGSGPMAGGGEDPGRKDKQQRSEGLPPQS